jgi:hypothetical protein
MVQGTSGGGGVVGLDIDKPLLKLDRLDILRRERGVVTLFAAEDWVGEKYVGGMLCRGFFGSEGGGITTVSSLSNSEMAHQDGS